MTRIGFAYNQKPESPAGLSTQSETPRAEEEPPSNRRDASSRNSESSASPHDAARGASVASPRNPADLYAEWDAPQTVDAVADALAAYGEVIRLEATPDFPERLRHANPDIVFNIAEGLWGVNREAHVPAICEFLNVPYSEAIPSRSRSASTKRERKRSSAITRFPPRPLCSSSLARISTAC